MPRRTTTPISAHYMSYRYKAALNATTQSQPRHISLSHVMSVSATSYQYQPLHRSSHLYRSMSTARQMSDSEACVMTLSAGMLRVSHTLPPTIDPLPIVMRPRIVAPA